MAASLPLSAELARLGVDLRPVVEGDRDFLTALYGSTRADELSMTGWSDEQKAAFVRMQFDAQSAHYARVYTAATHDLIILGGEPVGRLYVNRSVDEIRLVDITLIPKARGHGVGSALVRRLQEEAQRGGQSLTIHVERFNPALQLYLRMDFEPIEDKGVYLLLRWRAPNTSG